MQSKNSEDILCDDCNAPVTVSVDSYEDVHVDCEQCGATEIYPPEPDDEECDDIPF